MVAGAPLRLMGLYRSNDNRHSQLGRAGPPTQRRVDAGGARPTQGAFGNCRSLELGSERALTDFTMGGTTKGVAWSLNPYVGCLHACRYCYVPDTMHLERNQWGRYVAAKENLASKLRLELKTSPRKTVYVSTSTDPYQAPERQRRVTRQCLELLARHDWPVEILTRSPLVLRDLDLLGRFSQVRVGLSVPTLDDEARRLMEPHAPPIPARLEALSRLRDAGLTTFVNYSPAYPETNAVHMGDVAHAFREAGVRWVNTSYWRRVPSFLAPLWDRTHDSAWADFARFIADPQRQVEHRARLARAVKAVAIPLHVGFFNPPFGSVELERTSQMKLDLDPLVAVRYERPPEPEAAALEPPLLTVRRRS